MRAGRSTAVLAAAAGVLVALLGLEAALRFLGRTPWQRPRWGVEVRPDRPFFVPDPVVGYRLAPGRFEVALRDGRYTFEATHLASGTRSTGSGDDPFVPGAVWVFGCSFTYGWSLPDRDTWPSVLRERLGRPVVNFGANGYGNVQSLLQLREALRTQAKPAAVVLGYSWMHDMRNVFARVYRKAIAAPMESTFGTFRFAYARLEDEGLRFHLDEIGFAAPPLLERSALVNALERRWTTFDLASLRANEVTARLIDAFAEEARANGVRPLVAALDRHPRSRTIEEAAARGIATVDVSVDLRDRSFRNEPWDPHPNARAQRRYAEGVAAALEAPEPGGGRQGGAPADTPQSGSDS